MPERGYFHAWRKAFDPKHWLAPTKAAPASRLHAWLDICQTATHQDIRHRDTDLKRGEVVLSVRHLAERWRWSKSRVSRFIRELEARTAIETVSGTPYGTVYLVVNYDTYAGSVDAVRDSERDTKRDTSGTPAGQEQEQKNKRTTKKPLPEVVEVFDYWASERKRVLNLNGGPQPVLSAARSSKINARLGEGYDVATLKRAVDGCLASDFHLEGGHTDIELICRDQKHVEQFLIRLGQSQNGNGQHANPKARGRL